MPQDARLGVEAGSSAIPRLPRFDNAYV
jgi:hypothetical protein